MSPEAKWPWSVLGLTAMPATEAELRRAYARRLKQIDQATDIEGFTALREALQWAQGLMRDRTETEEEVAQAALVAPDPAAGSPAMNVTAESGVHDIAPAAVVDDPEKAAQRDKEKAYQALIAGLAAPNSRRSLGERIGEALASPFATDQDYASGLRYHIARILRENMREDLHGDMMLPESLDAATVQALDHRYGWLSDHAAFRRDFWNNLPLLDAMSIRAYGYGGRAGHRPPPGRWERFRDGAAPNSWMVILLIAGLIRVLAEVGPSISLSKIAPSVFVIIALAAVFAPVVIFMVLPYARTRFGADGPRTLGLWHRLFPKRKK